MLARALIRGLWMACPFVNERGALKASFGLGLLARTLFTSRSRDPDGWIGYDKTPGVSGMKFAFTREL